MKLNMWMIANRLSKFEIEVSLSSQAEMELNSAQSIYIPGCVRVFSDNTDLFCEHDQGTIRIKNLDLKSGYLLIQSIFDWYQDWLIQVDHAIISNDFEALAEACVKTFDNPVLIQDSNYRILGMSGHCDAEIPPEWYYILENGQSSVKGYEFMSKALHSSNMIYRQNVRRFQGKPGTLMPSGGLHATIAFRGRNFGKLTVLDSSRKLNRGDVCLFEYLSRRMAIYMAAISGETQNYLDTEIIESLAMGKAVPKERVTYFQSLIQGSREGKFSVLVTSFSDPNRRGDWRAFQLIKNIISIRFPQIGCNIINNVLFMLIYSSNPKILSEQVLQTVYEKGYQDELQSGLSLNFYNLSELSYFFEQAVNAQALSRPGQLMDFYDQAPRYLIEMSEKQRLCACEPELRHLWETEPAQRVYLDTLKVYLEEERSSIHAARRLFIHKNTLTYRIKHIREKMRWDFNNYNIRNYLRLSFYTLEREE